LFSGFPISRETFGTDTGFANRVRGDLFEQLGWELLRITPALAGRGIGRKGTSVGTSAERAFTGINGGNRVCIHAAAEG